jgi:hypothetical protein
VPNVEEQFGHQGGGVQFDLQGHNTRFTLGDLGPFKNAPTEVTQPWGDAEEMRCNDKEGGGTTLASPGQATQVAIRVPTPLYSGMSKAIQKWDVGDTGSQGQELVWQKGVEGEKTKITQFQEMVGALQKFKTYLFKKKGSMFCTEIHLLTKFMALNEATQHLQRCFMRFVGDCTLTRDPTPILLPTCSPGTPRQFSFQLRKPVNESRKWCPQMGLPSLHFMRMT